MLKLNVSFRILCFYVSLTYKGIPGNRESGTRDPSGALKKPENRDPSGTLQKPENWDPSGTLQKPENRDPKKNRELFIKAFLLRYTK